MDVLFIGFELPFNESTETLQSNHRNWNKVKA